MLVHVTADDIAWGCRGAAGSCPIARAISRTIKRDYTDRFTGYVSVGNHLVVLPTRDECDAPDVFKLPPAAVTFVKRFDNGNPVEPFTFALLPWKTL